MICDDEMKCDQFISFIVCLFVFGQIKCNKFIGPN